MSKKRARYTGDGGEIVAQTKDAEEFPVRLVRYNGNDGLGKPPRWAYDVDFGIYTINLNFNRRKAEQLYRVLSKLYPIVRVQ